LYIPAGSGLFAKWMHNGIDYGMLQAYGESFEILHARQSGQDESFLIKAITALPNESGGHAIKAE